MSIIKTALTAGLATLVLSGPAFAVDMGDMMNPSKWMGGNKDRRGEGEYPPPQGYSQGYPGGGPGYGAAPGYGYSGAQAPGYGGAPQYGAPGGYGDPAVGGARPRLL